MIERFLVPLSLTTGLLHASSMDFIRQIQTLNGQTVIYDTAVHNDKGEIISKPLEAEASIFQLYALETASNGTQSFTKLDEATIGTFLASVSAEVLSEDPYPVPRTRADRPYGMRITVSDMLTDDPEVPGYAKKLDVVRSYALYDAVTHQPNGREGEHKDQFVLRSNGAFVDNGIIHMLPEPEGKPTKACGEESFTVFMKTTPQDPRSELAKATIQIWPVADCEIQNLEDGKTYRGAPPNVTVALRDLYPNSETKTQIYKGQKNPGTVGVVLPNSVISYNTHLPQNANLVLGDLEAALGEDGWYTLEVLTKTPFNDGASEIIGTASFNLQRTIKLNSMMGTME